MSLWLWIRAVRDKDFIHHVYFFKRNLLNLKVKLVILKLCLFLLLLLTHVYFSCRLFHVCKKISLFSDLYLWSVFYFHGKCLWHTLLHVFTRSHATHPISHAKKKSDFGPRRVRSFSNSPTVDGAKERICNARCKLKRRAKDSQAPPIHPPVKPLCGSHGLRCAAPRAAPMVSALSLFFALDASLSRQETHWKMILNDINDIFYMIYDIN